MSKCFNLFGILDKTERDILIMYEVCEGLTFKLKNHLTVRISNSQNNYFLRVFVVNRAEYKKRNCLTLNLVIKNGPAIGMTSCTSYIPELDKKIFF